MPRNGETQELSQDRRARRPEPYQQAQSTRSGRGTATFGQTPRSGHLGNSGGSRSESSNPSRGSDPEQGSILGSTPRRVTEAEMVETTEQTPHGGSRSQSFRGGNDHQQGTSLGPQLRMVVEAERVEAADQSGNTVVKLVQKGVGDGEDTEWFSLDHRDGIWAVTADEYAALELVRSVKRTTGNRAVCLEVYSYNLDRFNAVQKNEIQSRVSKNNGRDANGFPAGLVVPKKTEGKSDCPCCPEGKHRLINCIVRCPEGVLSGCAICNSRSHLPDKCNAFKNMTLRDKVEWLVVKRARKPALRTEKPWYLWLHEWCNSSSYDDDLIKGFPWSVPFTKDTSRKKGGKYIRATQEKYDSTHDGLNLPVDPATENFRMVWKTYWKPLNLAWPSVLGQNEEDEEMVDSSDEEILVG
ncbi:hypothetical protein NW752_008524 [Fusarium irregulare]|uniref:Uncharacterized protein n=1 Tax=Fusarium irregulare TaxID=2494466 RepID=A0A9W8PWQ6_9HYPO|nr:hypothetical protein NW752_008524 [Fusarium irregulare]KAJ4020455.1 hypothetical protein NW766_001940 [Fusarium irregulare]